MIAIKELYFEIYPDHDFYQYHLFWNCFNLGLLVPEDFRKEEEEFARKILLSIKNDSNKRSN